ncbi:MAG: hypothetical protein KAH46_13780, partial [Mycobacterium sp.]|nr:hypothetical protein [Mycobacterium sp.]
RFDPHTFDAWWKRYGQPYETAVIDNDGTPWTRDLDERRQLWERRYQRPVPPQGLSNNLTEIRGTAYTVDYADSGADGSEQHSQAAYAEEIQAA